MTRGRHGCALAGIAAAVLIASRAEAANTSAYTIFDLSLCNVLTPANAEEESGGARVCNGLGDTKIYWAEGDLRVFMAYGVHAFEHCSAQQTFGAFNHVTPTVEWRLADGKPFAAVQRWFVSSADDPQTYASWLAVTKLEPTNSCRVALIEGALPDANAVARRKADELAPGFDCQKDTAQVFSRHPVAAAALMSGTPCGVE